MNSFRETILAVAKGISAYVELLEHRNQYTLLASQSAIVDLCSEFCNSPLTKFNMLIDITAIDHNKRGNRYEIVYMLASLSYKTRLRIKVPVYEKNPHCPSVVSVWEAANWYEREAYDMYGIHFDGHPDLRRFYMPEDFVNPANGDPIYPMRKDFPLMGISGSLPLPPLPERI